MRSDLKPDVDTDQDEIIYRLAAEAFRLGKNIDPADFTLPVIKLVK